MCTAVQRLKEEMKEQGRQESLEELILAWTGDGYSSKEIAKLLRKPENYVRGVQEKAGLQRV